MYFNNREMPKTQKIVEHQDQLSASFKAQNEWPM